MVLGLTSVTLLELTVDMILRLAHDNKLTVIEWSERHLRHGDTAEAARLKKLSENAGLTIAAYHPDFDICGGSDAEFEAILDTAAALGTDTVSLTIASGSGENPDDALDTLAHAMQHLAALAEAHSLTLCLSYRRGSVLEDYIRTTRFMELVAHKNVFVSWQPNRTSSLIYNIFELKMLAPFVRLVYVSYLDAAARYTPIIEGKDEWQQYLKVLKTSAKGGTLLFRDCKVEDFGSECALMQEWVTDICPTA